MTIILAGHVITVTGPMIVVGLYIDACTALIIYYVHGKRRRRRALSSKRVDLGYLYSDVRHGGPFELIEKGPKYRHKR